MSNEVTLDAIKALIQESNAELRVDLRAEMRAMEARLTERMDERFDGVADTIENLAQDVRSVLDNHERRIVKLERKVP